MATLGSLDLGFIFSLESDPSPKDRQLNAYPGVNGLQAVDGGARGGRSRVAGAIVQPDVASLAVAVAAFRALLADGSPYTLVDTSGEVWPNVILEQFQPEGVKFLVVGGYVGRRYRATLLHLS